MVKSIDFIGQSGDLIVGQPPTSDNQYWICRHARGNNRSDCRAAKCNHCISGIVNLPNGSSARAIKKALTKKQDDKEAKDRCLTNCCHDEPACFQPVEDFVYVEKKYNDKLRKEGKGDTVITNRCCECGDPILLESEGGYPGTE